MITRPQKIAISHVCMGRGGSEGRAMWGIGALVEAGYDVTLLTAGRVNLDELNAWCGTSLEPGDFAVREAPVLPGMRGRRGRNRVAAVRGTMFQRFCRQVAGEYDVLVSAYNPCDFGVPAVHFIGDFNWDVALMEKLHPRPNGGLSAIHRQGVLRRAYLGFAGMWRRPSGRDLFGGEDVLVANSKWTADLMRERYGQAEVQVVYPPVVGEADAAAGGAEERGWEEREAGFVCLGRGAHEKRIEQVIEILRRVRERGHDVHLHVAGPIGDDPYGRMIRRLVDEHATWVTAEGQVVGQAKAELLRRHKYALHGCRGEAFGIAVAEMVRAGCVTFVPTEGGPAEIVGEPGLCYSDVEEAVAKIDRVLRDEAEQRRLREHLAEQGRRFGVEQFKAEFRDVVEQFAARRNMVPA